MKKYLPILGLLALIIVNVWIYSFGFRLTADEIDFHLVSFGPLSEWASYSLAIAQGQGRIGHLLVVPTSVAAAYFGDWLIARLFFSGIYISTFVAFAYYVSLLIKRDIAVPLAAILIGLSPLLFHHTPPTSYPVQITVPYLILILSRIAILTGTWSTIARFAFIVGLLWGEYALIFGLALLILEHGVDALSRFPKSISELWKRNNIIEDGFSIIIVIIANMIFRYIYPPQYEGVMFDGYMNVSQLLGVMILQSWTGTSLAHFGWLSPSLKVWMVAFVLISATAFCFIGSRRLSARAAFVVFVALTVGWFITMFPIAATIRMQEWCYISGDCTYMSSRGALYFIGSAFFVVGMALSWRLLTIVTCFIVFFGFMENWRTSIDMRKYVVPYHIAMSTACSSSDFDPDPGNQISMHPHRDAREYWEEYRKDLRLRQGC